MRVCAVIGCASEATDGLLYCGPCADRARATRAEILRRFPAGPLCDDCAALLAAAGATPAPARW